MSRPNFWKQVTPIWFNWLGWFLALGAVGFVAEKTNNVGLWVIYGISYICFFLFVNTTISDIVDVKFVSHPRANKAIALIIALAVLAFTYVTLNEAFKGLRTG